FVDMEDMHSDNYFVDLAEKNGWLLLMPYANKDCMWWDDAGFSNILQQLIILKSEFNIDDNRVFLTGISDGGSGSFHIGMTHPDMFASFYPLIGMVSVGNLVNGHHTYIANLTNRFTAAVNCDEDGLYPAAKMRELMNLGQQAGADLFYKEFWGFGHDTEWFDLYKTEMTNKISTHPRDPFHSSLYWEISEPQYNKCDWLEITEIDTLKEASDWYKQYNIKLSDERMMFGFNHDQKYEGSGTLITNVVEGSAAEGAGLQKGDIIVTMDGKQAANIDTLITWRDAKKRGDFFILTVLRNGSEEFLEGQFPDVTYYDAFNLTKKSAAVKARYYGNHFEIETSRIQEITIYFHPEMINLSNPVTININGISVYNDKIDYDRTFMLQNWYDNFDRKALWINKILLKVPEER
ncbi:PDZ domain-containing protein, partial [Candidatus Cloacimonadota bacterium]